MLVLTRNPRESITVILLDGRLIEFKIIEVRGKQTRVGIEAPKDCRILRSELVELARRS